MIVCIIQARMGSTRLPGKVLRPILEKPMLAHQIERVQQSRLIDKIVVATTTKDEDDPIVQLSGKCGVACFRGKELDVLDRYYQAAKEARADIVIRITGDCPLSDPSVVDEIIEYFLKHQKEIDYTSKPTNYPEGLDMEIFPFSALERAWREGVKPSEREHVTPYIYTHPELFRTRTWQNGKADFSSMHWSVDTPEDFAFISRIFEELYLSNRFFTKDDVITLLTRHPDLLKINVGGTGYEGYAKSLKEDREFQEKKEIYEKLIGFNPEALILLSAGTVKEFDVAGKERYRSTKSDEGDSFGILWGEARVLATTELAKYFPEALIVTTSIRECGEPTHAEIVRDELVELSVDPSRIILEEQSDNTISQLGESLRIAIDEKWKKIALVTNEYHIPRVCAMYEHFDELCQDEVLRRAVKEIKASGVLVAFVSAEEVLPHRDEKFSNFIQHLKSSSEYQKRIRNEKQGVEMILRGTYGELLVEKKNKTERKD